MNNTLFKKVKTASKYQKKALYALLPENCAPHLEAIEHEMKGMMKEAVTDMVKDIVIQMISEVGASYEEEREQDGEQKSDKQTCKKVTID